MTALVRTGDGRLRFPLRLLWNDDERRPRAPVRLLAGVVVVLTFANVGRTVQPTPFTGTGPVADVANTLVGGVPQAAAIVLGVVLAALVLDRRVLTDLGLGFGTGAWRGFAGGLALGVGITALSVGIGVVAGFYEVVGVRTTGGPGVWALLVVLTGVSQLLIVVAEELLARGFLITNVREGLDGFPSIPGYASAAVAVAVASLFFYLTHSARGTAFGVMAAGLAVLLGVAYVLGGDLSVPVGVHLGVNFAGMLAGTAPQEASLVRLTSATTVAESLVLPGEAVAVRLVGAALGVGLLYWWYRGPDGRVRLVPPVARPTLRWNRDAEADRDSSG